MEMIKYYVKVIISFFLHIFWIFPIQRDKIFMMNDHSYSFSDNLKYLALDLIEKDVNKYKFYFSLKNDDGIENLPIISVKWLSLKHFYHALTSSVLITNNGGTAYLPVRKKQLVINTWHGGGPYKVTGTKALNDYYNMSKDEGKTPWEKEKEQKKKQRLIYWFEKDLKYNAKKIDYVLSSCKMCTEAEAKGLFFTDEQCVDSGMPRMDWMLKCDKVKAIREKVFHKYGISTEKKLILYAPTFRGFFTDYTGVFADDILKIDYKRIVKAAEERFGGEWFFAVRFHPRLKDAKINPVDLINMTLYPDAQELLMAADILITDYSSVMWDVSFTKNPVFVFAADINDYQIKRGFYLSPEEWPFPLASTNEEMEENIKKFNFESYERKVNAHHKYVGSFENGNACQTVKDIIDNHIAKNVEIDRRG